MEILSLLLNTQISYPSHTFAGDRKNLFAWRWCFCIGHLFASSLMYLQPMDKPSNDLFSVFYLNQMTRLIFLMVSSLPEKTQQISACTVSSLFLLFVFPCLRVCGAPYMKTSILFHIIWHNLTTSTYAWQNSENTLLKIFKGTLRVLPLIRIQMHSLSD